MDFDNIWRNSFSDAYGQPGRADEGIPCWSELQPTPVMHSL